LKIAIEFHHIFQRQADVHVFWAAFYDLAVIGPTSMINLKEIQMKTPPTATLHCHFPSNGSFTIFLPLFRSHSLKAFGDFILI